MTIQHYYGYTVRGLARPLVDDTFEGIGIVEKDGKIIGTSGPLGYFRSGDLATAEGLAWGKVWVDWKGGGAG